MQMVKQFLHNTLSASKLCKNQFIQKVLKIREMGWRDSIASKELALHEDGSASIFNISYD